MNNKLPPVIILAGGMATRLYPVTHTIPKAMIEIAGKPFIEHQINLLKENGITEIILCVQYLSNQIEDFIKQNNNFEISVQYSYDGDSYLGTGGAVQKALQNVDNDFFVLYGDSFLDVNYKKIYDFYFNSSKSGLMTIIKNNNNWDKSNVIFKDNQIIKYDKTDISNEMKFIDYGLGILNKNTFEGFFGKFDLSIIYQNLIRNDNLTGYVIEKRFYEIGSFQGINDTENYIINRGNINEL